MMAIAAVAVVKSRNGNGNGTHVDGSLLEKCTEGEVERDGARDLRDETGRAPERRAAESRVAKIRFTNECAGEANAGRERFRVRDLFLLMKTTETDETNAVRRTDGRTKRWN